MKSIPVWSSTDAEMGKLWVRPYKEGYHIHEQGGLIEISLVSLPVDGKLHCKTVVDCRRFEGAEIRPHRAFESLYGAQCFIDGHSHTGVYARLGPPVKLGSKYVVYLPG